MEERLSTVENNENYIVATLLDSKYKTHFLSHYRMAKGTLADKILLSVRNEER
jgi:hypothetical protein